MAKFHRSSVLTDFSESSDLDGKFLPLINDEGVDDQLIPASNTLLEARFVFDSNLDTTDEIFFRGQITGLTSFASDELDTVSFFTRLDTDANFTSRADLTEVQTFIDANVTSTTNWWLRITVSYDASADGVETVLLRYIKA